MQQLVIAAKAECSVFPKAWSWFFDEAVPSYVKQTYSPKEAWKDRPFDQKDARFFFRGVDELSDLFTTERPRGMPPYFRHPRFRSAYLLYFLPLQAAKFQTLFAMHEGAIDAALAHGASAGVLRVADIGAGPGTASVALLLNLLERHLSGKRTVLPRIEFLWCDTNRQILEDGKALIENLAANFPALRDRVSVRLMVTPWWNIARELRDDVSLMLLGHVLNEAPQSDLSGQLERLCTKAKGGGCLFVEPSTRRTSRLLIEIRDQWIGLKGPLWGPCLHRETCPLAEGRDWCHFSAAARLPGEWFMHFSKLLGSERQWLKFCYAWLANQETPVDKDLRRVVSDPIYPKGSRPESRPGSKMAVQRLPGTLLLCEPERPLRVELSAIELKNGPRRGDLVRIKRSGWLPFGSQRRVKAGCN